ncbi:hypothetical protein M5K25_011122 [Dendrobium thyrsiflorum]|uniref:Saposin B-type domain-containing protein n=1 Tax=Dendrobium thyrsiflorum TaxID=117978 RepID=A0ABD0V1G9_DENTH
MGVLALTKADEFSFPGLWLSRLYSTTFASGLLQIETINQPHAYLLPIRERSTTSHTSDFRSSNFVRTSPARTPVSVRLSSCEQDSNRSSRIGLCVFNGISSTSAGIKSVVDEQNIDSSSRNADLFCTACELAVVWIKNQLRQNQTEELILNYANEVCLLRLIILHTN